MSLISCPECGKRISDQAAACIHCGFPLSQAATSGVVLIKMPNNIVTGWARLLSDRKAAVVAGGKTLWKGRHGETARFTIDAPTPITIHLGNWAYAVTGTVYPGRRYTLVRDLGIHIFSTFRLAEVDVIDSE